MEKIGCERCHAPVRHNFPAGENACMGCHAGRFSASARTHLKTSSCLQCHSFS
ncbi:MAG: hypothetical protein M0Z75_05675 [Nitrospiraceae bacterium]|nr:hypothetical protein [Nitrospiraceae bacterium]